MLDWTDRHFRYFIRLLSPHCVLYTEMITTGALLHNDPHRFLAYSDEEHPVALQLGGSDPEALAKCVQLAQHYHYDEINLNVGCPSNRVQSGRFGACLMKEPNLVAECVEAMRLAARASQTFLGNAHPVLDAPRHPWPAHPSTMLAEPADRKLLISVKCRIGVDDQEDYETLENFIYLLKNAGCDHVIIHARKAWLKGLSPKENREIPPLNYPWVYDLKKAFPDFKIIINGGIKNVPDALNHLEHLDGVMIGRSAYENPYFFCELEAAIFSQKLPDRFQLIHDYLPYVESQLAQGVRLSPLARPILGLFNGLPGARHWRRYLSQNVHQESAGIDILKGALSFIEKSS